MPPERQKWERRGRRGGCCAPRGHGTAPTAPPGAAGGWKGCRGCPRGGAFGVSREAPPPPRILPAASLLAQGGRKGRDGAGPGAERRGRRQEAPPEPQGPRGETPGAPQPGEGAEGRSRDLGKGLRAKRPGAVLGGVQGGAERTGSRCGYRASCRLGLLGEGSRGAGREGGNLPPPDGFRIGSTGTQRQSHPVLAPAGGHGSAAPLGQSWM